MKKIDEFLFFQVGTELYVFKQNYQGLVGILYEKKLLLFHIIYYFI